MLAAALIVFREVLEAGLIVGVVLAATEGIVGRARFIIGGVAAGVGGACLVAFFAGQLAQLFQGTGQDVFNAAILLAAVAMLAWHILWMSRHAKELVRDAKALSKKINAGEATLFALATVVAVTMLREGSEVVLFLFGIAASGGTDPLQMLIGAVAGVGGGGIISFLIYRGLLFIPTGKLFSVTSMLVALLAAGMAGQAAVFLEQAGWLPSLGDQLWNTSGLLADDTLVGRALHALVGYSDRPMGVQLIAYLAVLVGLIGASRLVAGATPRRTASAT